MARPIWFYLQHLAFFLCLNAIVAYASRPHGSHRPHQEPSYLKFVVNATDFPSEDYYDYIIVGGGTAGCPLAATLSSRFRVLVIERGGIAYGNRNLMTKEVVTHANAERILVGSSMPSAVSRQSAMGVVFRDRIGMYHHALLREHGEVILSAGALGSPQLLLLSGIGPRPYLSSWGIPVAHHLPYVGQYLYDNPRNGISIVPPIPLEHSLIQVVGITESGAYIEAASNVIPFASPARSVFIRTPSAPLYLTVATLMEKTVGPASAGSLRLASTDVKVNPIVRFNYFSNPVDVQRCVNGTRKIGDILRTQSMEDFKFQGWFGSKDFRFVGPALPVDQSNYEICWAEDDERQKGL
ncbi:(R)-mandelonitrile lyase-like [Prunus yedoensis var. nudiflora]|uniref:(R)-mandelonitrile lyase-like n=1 Tax=Prunus yedoensis var. nudiflora TaxID=2094558 RepID=A0A314Z9H5_PRUYE|nr:(R)-mandelonitrile lyase-like [Prunus yedoensis var. nudiflora]